MIKKDVIDLYTGYGFEYRPELSEKKNLVFTITQGLFENAIVINLNQNEDTKIKTDFSKNNANNLEEMGFQVKIEQFISLKDSENKLFSGFFAIKKTKAAFERDYNKHIGNILAAIPSQDAKYSYIKSSFTKNSDNYDNDILNDINSEISSNGSQLILIEAAAGFGKTCTAYEIGKILSAQDNEHIVLFAELSRDRQAKIFNHVLLKEVARSFPAVDANLVLREIKKGKIIVILDGFDELLNEKVEEKYQFEKTQAMLETISEILENNAKVILTTRKTAILQGNEFDEWINSEERKFKFTRYSLKEPSVKNWLNHERSEIIEKSKINLKNLSNPVLLTFLKYLSDEDFTEIMQSPHQIVDKYFELILNREMSRQELLMTVEQQTNLLTRLARHLMLLNITRESKEDITTYLSDEEIDLIEIVRAEYSADVRPDFESMIEKLSNHALLDRSNVDEKIGFINNFVLGHFLSIDLVASKEEWLADSIFLEATVNAYSTRDINKRITLWDKLQDSLVFATEEDKVRLELRLLDRVTGKFENAIFKEINFETNDFFKVGKASSCIFNECTFTNCLFDFKNIKDCTFISCTFYECTSTGEYSGNEFISPTMDNNSNDSLIKSINKICVEDNTNIIKNDIYEYILEKFWPVGKNTVAFAHRPMFIFYRGSKYSTKDISDGLEELKRIGLLISAQRKNWVGIDLTGSNINTIKEILGR